jgi:hypothetical protein
MNSLREKENTSIAMNPLTYKLIPVLGICGFVGGIIY